MYFRNVVATTALFVAQNVALKTLVTIPNTKKELTLPCGKYQVVLKHLSILNLIYQRSIPITFGAAGVE